MAEPSEFRASRCPAGAPCWPCAGAACAAVLAGCSTYNSNNGRGGGVSQAPPQARPPRRPHQAGSGSGVAARAPPRWPAPPTFPVRRRQDPDRQEKSCSPSRKPASSTGFSATCTHAGCTVGSVSDGTINCPCPRPAGSASPNGAVVTGPATSPLPTGERQGARHLDRPGLTDQICRNGRRSRFPARLGATG